MIKSDTLREIQETIEMVSMNRLDIRTVTMGINILPAGDPDPAKLRSKLRTRLHEQAKDLVNKASLIEKRFGIPIINKRITVTPVSLLLESVVTGDKAQDLEIALTVAQELDRAAQELGVDFLGGYGALVEGGMRYTDQIVMESLPSVLSQTERVCSFVNVGTTKAGITMRAVARMGDLIHQIAHQENGHIAACKLVVFCNAVPDNPFMAGGFHGISQTDTVIHVGISGPGVVRNVIENLPSDIPLDELSTQITNTAFKLTRAGETIGTEIARQLRVRFGSIDLSLAPTTADGDSVGLILERMGLDRTGAHGSTAALALLTDAVKKGGVMASSHIGGLSGAFIPVAEDAALAEAAAEGTLTIDKLEAMTSVCSVGLDMIPIPGDTRSTTIAGIIADEMAIGMVNHKTTAVRLIPVAGKTAGESVTFGGLLGGSTIMPVSAAGSDRFIWRKGRIPAPITSFRN